MFLTIALVLIVLWALGFFVFPVAGGLVHILLLIAIAGSDSGVARSFFGRK
jgi:hypothetical protein